MIEEAYNIESMLENNSFVTKEMEYYAQIYEIEQSLKQENQKQNLVCIAKTLDALTRSLNLKSNIYLQYEYSKYKSGKSSDRNLLLTLSENQPMSMYDSQILTFQSESVSLYQNKLE